jgi:membrane protein YdbS with pleckstrin-like domain
MYSQKTYKSKIGIGLSFFMAIVLIGSSIAMSMETPVIWLGILFNLIIALFVTYTFTNTKYVIDSTKLQIKCGFLYNKTIPIQDIKRIEESRSPLSSPAASLDRLEIIYNKFDSILISPKEKKAFVEDMIKINSGIEVKWRK